MKVYAPNKGYTGVSASVAFCNGVGETDDPHLLEWFRDRGYEVEETALPEPPIEELPMEEPPKEEAEAGTEKKKVPGKKVGE